MEFVDATPVPGKSNGRPGEPNPFTDIVAAIAGKKDEKTGVAVAKSFVDNHGDGNPDERDKARSKIRRQMTDAGAACNPKVSVRIDYAPIVVNKGKANERIDNTKTVVTFWTIPHITKPRKASTPETSTPEVPATAPAE